MRFDNLNEDDEDTQPISKPKSVIPTADRTSRAIRIKLAMLFAMLVLVIVLMKEAGKPERWEWMGFEKQEDQSSNIDRENAVELDTAISPLAGPEVETSRSPQIKRASSDESTSENSTSQPISLDASGQFDFRTSSDDDYPPAAVKFWAATFRKLGSDRQRQFLRLLKQMRTGKKVLDEDATIELRGIVRLIARQRDEFHQEMFNRLALASEDTEEKTKLSTELFDSQDLWEKKIFPALDAATQGDDFTVTQQQAIFRLQNTLDNFVFQQVRDKTTIGWAGDTSGWLRLWELAESGSPHDTTKATRIELIGEPGFYRGKAIQVAGWVRSARIEKLKPGSETGLEQYYELWVRPRESKLGPYNIYVRSLPAGFPQLTSQLKEINVNVVVEGYFFKIRSYKAADQSIENCPVIIAPTVKIIPDIEFAAVNRWQPGRGFIIGAFLFIPLLATGLAWFAFKTSQTRQYSPGKKTAGKINDTLTNLSKDPSIQTDKEKIMALYQDETSPEASHE